MNATRCTECSRFTSKKKEKHVRTVSLVDAVHVTVTRMLCPRCFKIHINDILEKEKASRQQSLYRYSKKAKEATI